MNSPLNTLITVKSLSEHTKDDIVESYKSKHTLASMAKMFNTSSRTIGRVLEERGLLTPVPRLQADAKAVMAIMEKRSLHAVDLDQIMGLLQKNEIFRMSDLEAALSKPAVTPQAVQTYLNQCSKEVLATHFYTSGLVKLAEIAEKANARKQEQASLFRPPVQAKQAHAEAVPS